MSDRDSSIWREDEGQAAGRRAALSDRPTNLFERAAPHEADTQRRDSLDLWRSDEGQPHREVRRSPTPAPVTAPTPPPSPGPGRRERRGTEKRVRFRWRVLSGAIVVLLSLALIVDGALALITIRDRLGDVAAELEEVEQRLATGDLPTATESAEEALAKAGSAQSATGRPGLSVAALIPEARREVEALRGAVDAAQLSAQAAGSVVSGASALGLDDEGVPSEIYIGGQIQLQKIEAAAEYTQEAEVSLNTALNRLDQLEPRLEQLQSPIADAHVRIGGALERITEVSNLMDVLPSLFGAEDQRRYLLAFQAPGEARGTGGLVGLAAILEADEGRIELGEPVSYTQFAAGPSRREVDAPAWFSNSYGPQQALTHWPQANVSPNYPVVAEVLLKVYEDRTGQNLDGVVTMDPIAMQELMMGADPIEIHSPRTLIDSSNVAKILLHDSYTEFETQDEQNRFLAKVVDGFWTQVAGGDIDLKRFAEGLGNAITSQHFKLYVRKASDQRSVNALGLGGNYDVGPNTQMVFNVNYAANKVDYFLHRDLDIQIELQPDGDAEVTTTMLLENRAPAAPASPLLVADASGLEPGVNRMTINVLMPPETEVESLSIGGESREPFTYIDEDSPIVWDVLEIPPGGSETVSVSYVIPEALHLVGQGTAFDFSLYPQATVNPDTFSLSISPPPGVEVVDTHGGLSDAGRPSMMARLDEPVSVRVVLEQR